MNIREYYLVITHRAAGQIREITGFHHAEEADIRAIMVPALGNDMKPRTNSGPTGIVHRVRCLIEASGDYVKVRLVEPLDKKAPDGKKKLLVMTRVDKERQ